ncbi:hypothetical protein SK128_022876, partial [Halocaridina rubra]
NKIAAIKVNPVLWTASMTGNTNNLQLVGTGYSLCPVQQLGSALLCAPVPFRCSTLEEIHVVNSTNISSFLYVSQEQRVESNYFTSKCLAEDYLVNTENVSVAKIEIGAKEYITNLPSCPVVEYDTSDFQSTVITEWHLICERSTLRPLFQMIYAIGVIIGCAICGQLSDWLGRKRIIQMALLLLITGVVAASLVPWYTVMLCMRALTGMSTILLIFPSYTLVSEISPPNLRTSSSILPGIAYFVAMSLFGGVAYLFPVWRHLLLMFNSPLLLMIPMGLVITESPRWLIQNGREDEGVNILRQAASQNGVVLSASTSLLLEKLSKTSKDNKEAREKNFSEGNQNTLQMLKAGFSAPGMRTILLVMPVLWILKRALYVGIALNANNFASSNPFQYITISGAMGLVALIVSTPISLKLTRKAFTGGGLALGGILLLLELAVPSVYWWIKWVLVMVSFCLVAGAFQINYIYGNELFPTVFRARGFSLMNCIASAGEMGIPLVTDLIVQYYWWAPSVTFGCMGILASLLLLFLPETKDRPMPETLQDVEERYKNNSLPALQKDLHPC